MMVNVVLKIGIFKIIIGIIKLKSVIFLYRLSRDKMDIVYLRNSDLVFFIKILVG